MTTKPRLYTVTTPGGLKVLNGPGAKPSSTRFAQGEIVEFDGTEYVDVPLLLRQRAITPYRKKRAEKLAEKSLKGER